MPAATSPHSQLLFDAPCTTWSSIVPLKEKAPQIMMAPPPLCRVENLSALPSQMPSDGYWAAVSTSNGLNLGRGSSRVLTDSHSDPLAQRRLLDVTAKGTRWRKGTRGYGKGEEEGDTPCLPHTGCFLSHCHQHRHRSHSLITIIWCCCRHERGQAAAGEGVGGLLNAPNPRS
ncbi:unnamed protein product [Pleuronectes platessa]|uniref:Uncharacterized protein n=1 Tax=Pleuronectes platessa TaxID=8262 RepID=A0A9N7U786_PLEPL|nr:unnamed protein product [Pleuronectes platessa]